MATYYQKPELPTGASVHRVVAENANGLELTPDTEVRVFNRALTPQVAKFDGQDHVFEPGFNDVAYGIARHAQEKLVVPGSRNSQTGAFESFLGIPGVDPDELCRPFTVDELTRFGLKPEAIDRMGDEGAFQVLSTTQARARIPGQAAAGRGRRPQNDSSEQGSEQAREAARYALQPAVGGDAAKQSGGVEVE